MKKTKLITIIDNDMHYRRLLDSIKKVYTTSNPDNLTHEQISAIGHKGYSNILKHLISKEKLRLASEVKTDI